MFNSTTLKLRRTGRTRRPERLFIFLLSLLCFSNSFCMDQSNLHKAQLKTNNAIQALSRYGKVLKKEYSLDALPDEVLLNIFKYCAQSMQCVSVQHEIFLAKMFRRLALTNKRFNVLLQDKTILLEFFNTLEKIKQKYYKSWNLNYELIQNSLCESYVELSGSNLVENMKKFKFAKRDNLDGMMRKEKGKFLLEGAKKGDLEIVNLALSNDADIEIKDNGDLHRSTPLMIAASNGNENLVKFLIRKGSKIGYVTFLYSGSKAVAKIIFAIADKVILNERPSALIDLIRDGGEFAAEVLIENHMDVNIRNDLTQTALEMAAARNKIKIVEMLINACADINSGNRTALHWAAENGNLEIVNFLLSQNNISIDLAKGNDRETPLLVAVHSHSGKYMEIIEALINKGSDIEAKNKIGRTPLMYAAYYNCQDIAQFLLEKGANIYEKDNHGKTALDIAREYDQKQMIYILKGGWKGKIKELVSFSLTTWGCASLTVLLIKSLNDYTNA